MWRFERFQLLDALYLVRSHQRRGLGRALFGAAVDHLQPRFLIVWVLHNNPGVRVFYERLEGRPAGSKPFRLGDVTLEVVAYGWKSLTDIQLSAGDLDGAAKGR